MLSDLGFDLGIDNVRIPKQTGSSDTKATVKVEDQMFARTLSTTLSRQRSALKAVPMRTDPKRTDCRKVRISWHKATRSVWVNFGNGDIANRVAQKFNEGTYKCLGQSVRSSAAKNSACRGARGGRGGRSSFSSNPVAWTITLSDVPGSANSKDIEKAISLRADQPRHVEMSSISYEASNVEVKAEVRARLEEYGRLESFYVSPASRGKRMKASAWFQDEADAKSACSMNNKRLDILGRGKLTVALLQSAKVKVSMAVYLVLKSSIEEESHAGKERHVVIRAYPNCLRRFMTLKIEGDDAREIVSARKRLEEAMSGTVLTDGQHTIWDPVLNNNRNASQRLKPIEGDLDIVITRDKTKRQLCFYGPPERFQQAVRQVTDMLRADSSWTYEIDLKPHQFSWTVRGGFKSIEHALGHDVAVFNVVSRRITITGTQQQYQAALALIDGKRSIEICQPSHTLSVLGASCPICFCEADTPIQTTCKHTYCLECFEDCCKSAASTSKTDFQVQCQSDEGTCATVFSLRELKDHLSSAVFESVLKSSFDEYISRHPEAFHYCPTPDCGYIYRCTTASDPLAPAYTCPNCLEPICRSCRARHGDYTCAEYKDIASGGYEALERLKKELNIKDCPNCSTPMEKTEGCNHMTCGGCRTHICWVCMAVFETQGPCYAHMTKEHGGIGLGLDAFMFA